MVRRVEDAELDQILQKSFEDIRRRVGVLMAKREKKLLKTQKQPPKPAEAVPARKVGRPRKNPDDKRDEHHKHHRSESSESDRSE